ncbi:hypothetical protein EJB05_06143 [Eragrostis curvula]|uniref:GBF-interacting protein 1 N-terminal domain-containing protein n=1 Tax=Eragrostis curvula TaxID=38414 RepID=A0A5J9WGS1_9POAL|nr:hypothetical protein EJB05_06143 [Eragrostis curvula]
MASRGGYHSGFNDSFRNGTRRHDNNKENTSQPVLNARQAELARSGRVPNRYTNSGGVMQEYRIVKDNRTKQKEASGAVPEVDNSGESSIEHAVSSVGGKSSTEKLAALDSLVTGNVNGHEAAQADNCIKSAALAHDKEASSVRKMEQSGGIQTLVGSHEVLGKGIQNREVTVTSGKNSFAGELCCSSSDPIHVPSPGSKSAGTFGAIKREVGVVGARQRPSDKPGTNTCTSNGLVKVASTPKDNPSNEQQSGLPGSSLKNGRSNVPVPLNNRPFPSSQYHHKPQNHVSQTKASAHLEWKPKSISPSSTNHEVSVSSSGAPLPVDGNQAEVAVLSKKLSQANVSRNEQVIIPEHIRVPDSKITHLIFGTFESDVSDTSGTTSDTVVTKECLNDHSPSSLTALNAMVSTDISPNDKMDHAVSQSSLPQSDSNTSVSEHQRSSSEAVDVQSPGVVGEYVTEMISSKVVHSQPQFQHQDNLVVPNFKKYEPDSRYGAPFITKAVDDEAAESIAYPSEVLGLHPANANQLPAATQQPVPQMYPQQFQVPQYPNFLPYRHVYPPHYMPPVVVPNYSSNPAFPQLPHASSYLVMPNGTSQLAANGMKYGLPHQYKQMFPGTPTGYGGYANHNGYTVNAGVIGSTGPVEDGNMSKYKDNNLYPPNLQAETADLWVQGHREIPNMPSAPFYSMVGQPMSPHAAYLPSQNSHAAFTPAPPHPGQLQYPGFPHPLQPTSMTMVQNPQAMVHQAAVPQLAGNVGLDMAAMAPGSQARHGASRFLV